jgi:hypothetical protein
MAALRSGSTKRGKPGDKRHEPIGVLDLGNGKFKVVDGNTTFHALLELGETEAVAEVLEHENHLRPGS